MLKFHEDWTKTKEATTVTRIKDFVKDTILSKFELGWLG